MNTSTHSDIIHIFVTVGQGHPMKIEFVQESASGLEIKRRAGFGEVDGLYERVQGDVAEIADDQIVHLKNGLHFVIVPNGRVS